MADIDTAGGRQHTVTDAPTGSSVELEHSEPGVLKIYNLTEGGMAAIPVDFRNKVCNKFMMEFMTPLSPTLSNGVRFKLEFVQPRDIYVGAIIVMESNPDEMDISIDGTRASRPGNLLFKTVSYLGPHDNCVRAFVLQREQVVTVELIMGTLMIAKLDKFTFEIPEVEDRGGRDFILQALHELRMSGITTGFITDSIPPYAFSMPTALASLAYRFPSRTNNVGSKCAVEVGTFEQHVRVITVNMPYAGTFCFERLRQVWPSRSARRDSDDEYSSYSSTPESQS